LGEGHPSSHPASVKLSEVVASGCYSPHVPVCQIDHDHSATHSFFQHNITAMSPEFVGPWQQCGGAPCPSSGENAASGEDSKSLLQNWVTFHIASMTNQNECAEQHAFADTGPITAPRMLTCLVRVKRQVFCADGPVRQKATKERKSCCDRTRLVCCPHDWG
jgi:hypothetical protein